MDSNTEPTMEQRFNPKISPIIAAFIGLVGGFILYQIVGGLLTLLIFGLDIENAPINGVRLMTTAGQILFILLPAIVFSKLIYSNLTEFLRVKLPNWKEVLLFTLGIVVLTILLQNYLYIQNYFLDMLANNVPIIKSVKDLLDTLNEYVEKTYGNLLKANNIFEAILIVFVVAVIPALSEEAMFRGFIQRSFEFKMKPFYAALLTAIFFGANHFNPYGLIPLIILGLYFGYAAYMSNSIIIPIILHFLNNFTAVMLYFVFGDDELISSTISKSVDLSSSFAVLVAMSVIFSGLIFLIKKYYSNTIKI
ncbi:MAG: CPBP family intramembrane metalloprotease [Ignavibacteriaceae bacterium]|nr:CPBP family intramembrane metalloprotease [Ignavibacteriaceae bacterium]